MIRPAARHDTAAVRRLSREVFSQYGDYEAMLPPLVDATGVTTAVHVDGGCIGGFVMVGLAIPHPDGRGPAADLLAIAVDPVWQGRGVGTQLLHYAFDVARQLRARYGASDLRLSVADSNTRAQRFFTRWGFRVVSEAGGRYPAGQVAIHMSRPIEAPAVTRGP